MLSISPRPLTTERRGEFHFVVGDATCPDLRLGRHIIAHVVNDRGGFGKGFAAALAKRYPGARRHYKSWTVEPDFQLGNTAIYQESPTLFIAHLLAQCGYISTAKPRPLSLTHLESCLCRLVNITQAWNATLHFPRIGTGFGGAPWSDVEKVMHSVLDSTGLEVFIYTLPGEAHKFVN